MDWFGPGIPGRGVWSSVSRMRTTSNRRRSNVRRRGWTALTSLRDEYPGRTSKTRERQGGAGDQGSTGGTQARVARRCTRRDGSPLSYTSANRGSGIPWRRRYATWADVEDAGAQATTRTGPGGDRAPTKEDDRGRR